MATSSGGDWFGGWFGGIITVGPTPPAPAPPVPVPSPILTSSSQYLDHITVGVNRMPLQIRKP